MPLATAPLAVVSTGGFSAAAAADVCGPVTPVSAEVVCVLVEVLVVVTVLFDVTVVLAVVVVWETTVWCSVAVCVTVVGGLVIVLPDLVIVLAGIVTVVGGAVTVVVGWLMLMFVVSTGSGVVAPVAPAGIPSSWSVSLLPALVAARMITMMMPTIAAAPTSHTHEGVAFCRR